MIRKGQSQLHNVPKPESILRSQPQRVSKAVTVHKPTIPKYPIRTRGIQNFDEPEDEEELELEEMEKPAPLPGKHGEMEKMMEL